MQIEHSSQLLKARQPRQVVVLVDLMQNLRLKGRLPPIIFARIANECLKTLSLTTLTRNFR